MSQRKKLTVALLLVMLLTSALAPAAGASLSVGATRGGGPVRLESSTDAGVTFEVVVPWQQVRVEPVTEGGKEYVRVSLAGWPATTQAGAPLLPQMVQVIGVPFGAALSVKVEPGRAHRISLPAPSLPVATQKVDLEPPAADGTLALPTPRSVVEEDPAIYSGDAAYPGALAEVANDGVMRQQRVAGIVAYPVQYNPASQELTVYESLTVQVVFDASASGEQILAAGPAAAESPVYESLFQGALLNYDAARDWRSAVLASPAGRGAGAKGSEAAEGGIEAIPWAPPVPGWRVKVREEGFYRLTYAQLLAKGVPVDTSLPCSAFRLFNLGSEVAIYVSDHDGDGVFEDGGGVPENADFLLFYGQAVVSKYTRDNVYWVTYGGTGLRMGTRDGTPGSDDPRTYYAAVRQMEGSGYYVQKAPGDDDLDRWLWDYIMTSANPSRPSWTYTFALAGPYAGTYSSAKLTVVMLGYLENPLNPDHHARISLNGTQVADVTWDGITWKTVQVPIAQSLLRNGTNTLVVMTPNDTGVGNDTFFIDRAELEFANTFVAEADVLAFSYDASGPWKFEVHEFSNDQLAVYDVTNPAAPVQITGVAPVKSGNTWTAGFQDPVATPRRFWATATTAYRTDAVIDLQDTASNLGVTTNGADHIVITHKDFSTQAAQLSARRASQGLRAMVVDVQDVYDEFGYGLAEPAAIHDFLAYAYNSWQKPAPSFVALVGDGHYDPKNYVYTRTSFIHPYLAAVDPWIVETAADNRYVTLVDDDPLPPGITKDTFPDMMLGRLAVNDTTEASAFVNKILAYESSPVPGPWQWEVLAVADNADGAGNFPQASEDLLACCLRAPYQAEKVYYGVTHTTVDAARAAILGDTVLGTGINGGKLIVNYIGHGASSAWASEALFRASDIAGLTNGGKTPVMLPMTCYDGFYHYPHSPVGSRDCTAELITRAAGKGAVASWSPTGLGVATGHDYLDRGFFQRVFSDPDGRVTVGEATAAGKLNLWPTGHNLDLLDTYLLFGDPATVMTIAGPTAVELLSFTATGAKKSIILKWETATEVDNLGFNLYRATSVDGERTKLNAALISSLVPPGSPDGAVYSYTDKTVKKGITYTYWLEAVDIYGGTELFGPVEARAK